jgi:ABC-2 type transport system permease protein
MKSYFSYFKLKFITGLQYKASAYAGVSAQIFFGLIYIFVYIAFYESDSSNLPMPLNQLVSYLWFNQCFFALVYMWFKDKDIINMIKTGNIAYELCRPQNLYLMWFSKMYAERLSKVILRILPVVIFALILPSPFNLDLSTTIPRFILFILSLGLASILVVSLSLLYHIICLYTLDEKGIVNMFMVVSDILSGLTVPIPFFPSYLQKISDILPFRYVSDFPFRLYIGNISINEGLVGICVQLVWIIILVSIGYLLMKKALKKAVIQGG